MKTLFSILLSTFIIQLSWTQENNFDNLFSPTLIIKYKNEITLSEIQEKKIIDVYEDIEKDFNRQKDELLKSQKKIGELHKQAIVDLKQAEKYFNEIVDKENQIKRLKYLALVNCKNILTKAQQTKLTHYSPENANLIKDYFSGLELYLDGGSAHYFAADKSIRIKSVDPKKNYIMIDALTKEVIAEGDINDINPFDIKSISVYKSESGREMVKKLNIPNLDLSKWNEDTGVILIERKSKPLPKGKSITLTGKVIEAQSGKPLIGVAVIIENTTKGTVTDINGEFSLKTNMTNQRIIFRYVGNERILDQSEVEKMDIIVLGGSKP